MRSSTRGLTDQALPAKVCGDTITKFPPNRFLRGPELQTPFDGFSLNLSSKS